jgi:L-asparaginase
MRLFDGINHELTDKDLLHLAKTIHKEIEKTSTNGVVITMGTNAIEDVAFFIDCVTKTHKPIVITGANYPQGHIGYDGLKNLHNAMIIASSTIELPCLSTMLTFDNKIIAAKYDMKYLLGLSNDFMIKCFFKFKKYDVMFAS